VDVAPHGVLLRLHHLLDDDDHLLGVYRQALEADSTDSCPGVVHLAHQCTAALNYLVDVLAPLCAAGPAAWCVHLGLLPFGAWAVGAALYPAPRAYELGP
jgi:hypothetical protein